MATIVNSMERRTANSKSRNKAQQLILKSFIMGAMGYLVFLFTLATTYWFISKQFRFGLTKIDNTDLIISLVGFFSLFASYFIRGRKHNNFQK
ncbi:MAG: hypothetical protein A2315_00225 [Ignavibacteria bacterium RIFOXYB2_FULL_35_12]|nr:MAG: hypothetical protein A2058_09650 [Ignavibacteria bacterium GWA2_36_19]OGU48994.1 MAG: hypothetical protein A2006_11625 [Ignavibacteria bacterium GWC2_35_8]OGU57637.1 MAG: hypothetical protein A2X60_05300 [Ignavibacteria bacterium GWF2_35_20]OGU76517.1 MAG: hypothetical protein A2W11_03000 [Ignavibacteria bacterium RBG_16_35_7]OGU82116.1 MAG: hypothetical protein A2254_13130 [Ignavibacteria bacterium RIFOXYA2_FULL_35_9]OGU84457.1 MAG: hypothetical protein A3K31_11115 [Ignavibacteria bac